MIQVCDPPRTRQVRRLSTEEFCQLVRGEVSCVYRPRSEVLRMLTVGEACGVCDAAGAPAGAVLLQPLNADTALAAALRAWAGWRGVEGGQFLTPPVLHQPDAAEPLLRAAFARAERLARGGRVLAVLECTAQSDALLPLYIRQGLALRALRPLNSLAPCFGRRVRGPGPGAGVGAAAGPCPAGPSAGKRVCGTGQPTDRWAGDLAGYVPGITTRV